jgi:hypothetical protein
MASVLSLPSVALSDLRAITPLVERAATTREIGSNTALPASPSSVVQLSELGRFLAATTTGTPPQIASTTSATAQTSPVVTVTATGGALNADSLAVGPSASAASLALQDLVNDPAVRAIANNLFNPVYSALLAAAHQQDFNTPQALTRANAIPVDIPAEVLPVDRVEGGSNDNQAARQFAYRQSPESSLRRA